MKYPLDTATGDAGEFFFAYKITSELNWPCRLFDIDIGIDAQVEILDSDQTSTGRFTAFQIKATREPEKQHTYVAQRQLTYWQSLKLPVFIVLVNLSTRKMFLQLVTRNRDYPDPTGRGNVRIDFDPRKDRFSASSRKKIATAAERAALAHIRKHLDAIRAGIDEIDETIASLDDGHGQDFVDLIVQHTDWKNELAQARRLSHVLNAGARECDDVAAQLREALSDLHDAFNGSYRDWNDDGQLTSFFEESGWKVD
ncbi:DUF4365 domain-containing protein [Burkholderia gladioli]|uniref:DUF4365 domain-containing protein n=1 Tax=Burkholderia gladioli TaxID=28095 RepID=UPI00264B926E|nr:DUF4365 domain-containing protein [Burkholderia gladioli]MDN7805147.1 DUF4365 domain-containing protein [Burkholderia gladioli]